MHASAPAEVGTDRASWQVLRPTGRWGARLDLRELWSFRELALMLALRDLQLRYRQTLFGVGWAILQPAAAGAVFSIVFGSAVGVPSDGLPYPIFVLTGLAIWSFISSAVSAAAESLVDHRELVEKVWFPRVLAPTAAVFAVTLDLFVGVVFVVPFMIGYGVEPPLQLLTLPVWLIGAVAIAVAAGLWLSAANVLYRDVRYALAFLLQLWLFASPVVFPSSIVEGDLQYVLALNPVAGAIDGLRWSMLGAPAPGPELAVSAAALIVMLAGGVIFFRRTERTFADRI